MSDIYSASNRVGNLNTKSVPVFWTTLYSTLVDVYLREIIEISLGHDDTRLMTNDALHM